MRILFGFGVAILATSCQDAAPTLGPGTTRYLEGAPKVAFEGESVAPGGGAGSVELESETRESSIAGLVAEVERLEKELARVEQVRQETDWGLSFCGNTFSDPLEALQERARELEGADPESEEAMALKRDETRFIEWMEEDKTKQEKYERLMIEKTMLKQKALELELLVAQEKLKRVRTRAE